MYDGITTRLDRLYGTNTVWDTSMVCVGGMVYDGEKIPYVCGMVCADNMVLEKRSTRYMA